MPDNFGSAPGGSEPVSSTPSPEPISSSPSPEPSAPSAPSTSDPVPVDASVSDAAPSLPQDTNLEQADFAPEEYNSFADELDARELMSPQEQAVPVPTANSLDEQESTASYNSFADELDARKSMPPVQEPPQVFTAESLEDQEFAAAYNSFADELDQKGSTQRLEQPQALSEVSADQDVSETSYKSYADEVDPLPKKPISDPQAVPEEVSLADLKADLERQKDQRARLEYTKNYDMPGPYGTQVRKDVAGSKEASIRAVEAQIAVKEKDEQRRLYMEQIARTDPEQEEIEEPRED